MAGGGAGAGEQGGAVAVGVGVDDGDRLIHGRGLQHTEHRAEDLFLVDGHVGADGGEDRRADEVAVLVAGDLRMAAIEQQLCAFLHTALDQAVDALQRRAGHHRADVGAGLAAGVDLEGLGLLDQLRQPGLGLADQDHHRQRHAALAGGPEGGADQVVEGLLLVGIRQDDGVVLGAHHALRALAVLRGAVVDVGADLGRADEGHRLDVRVIADQVDRLGAAVDHVEHARRDAGLQRQLGQAHGDHRVLLGGLEDEGVAGGDGHREHPQRDHRREVERGDAGAHAQRLQQGVGVDAAGDVVGQLAELQVADAGGVLDHLQAAEHVAFGVRQGLALFGGEDRGQLLHVLADQLLVLEEDACAGADRGLAPGLEGGLGAGHGGVHLVLSGEGHAGQHFLGGRVDHVAPLGGGGLDELAVDQQLDGGDGAGSSHGHLAFAGLPCCCSCRGLPACWNKTSSGKLLGIAG
ncbi:hypothetical protein D3C78_901350 [compost metagenome]